MKQKIIAVVLVLTMIFALATTAFASSNTAIDNAVKDTAQYLQKTVNDPQVGSIGGEWSVLGLARSGENVPQSYYDKYYSNLEKYVKDCGGVLDSRKYTEYSRVILAVTAIGKDPTNVAGYNLVTPLGNYEKTIWQGINGGIFALIALDSGNYDIPTNPDAKTQATRQMYVDFILGRELENGGWALTGKTADPDITAMALQALAKYQNQAKVKAATDRALTALSNLQDSNGDFTSWGTVNCESTAQVIVALTELGISLTDSRFVKNGKTPIDSIMQFYQKGNGFTHVLGGGNGVDLMSTEQAFYAIVSIQRTLEGKSSLYRMVENSGEKPMFSDVVGHKNQFAIEELAKREVVNGMGNGTFKPNQTMTRAEFCTIVVKALGLTPKYSNAFTDVTSGKWYSNYIGAAYEAGIVNGVGNNKFNPDGTVTQQEAATMMTRACKYCGINTDISENDITTVLAKYTDGEKVAGYAKSPMAFCAKNSVLEITGVALRPTEKVMRYEMAQMIYNMMDLAGKL